MYSSESFKQNVYSPTMNLNSLQFVFAESLGQQVEKEDHTSGPQQSEETSTQTWWFGEDIHQCEGGEESVSRLDGLYSFALHVHCGFTSTVRTLKIRF